MALSDEERKEQRRKQNKRYISSPGGRATRQEYNEKNRKKTNERARANYTKPEQKAKKQEYLEKNKEKITAKRQEYNEKNKEIIKERNTKYNDSLAGKAKRQEYIEKNKEKIKKYNKEYRRNHLEEDAIRTGEYRKRHPEKIKQSQRLDYIKHKDKRLLESKKEYLLLKLKVFEKYSSTKIPSCKLCLESDLVFLTLDHIRGRKAEGHSTKFSGDKLWRHLRQKEFPSGYQILCWNCNVLKYRNEPITYSNNISAIRAREKNIKQKKQVFTHYSNGDIACRCCGFKNILALGMDHIKPKKTHGHSNRLTSNRLYAYLIKENFPLGYQIFCYNCNGAKGQQPLCPHQLDKTKK